LAVDDIGATAARCGVGQQQQRHNERKCYVNLM